MSGRRTPKKPARPDPNAWMVTFSDLLMLMLTFFVLLLSMSSLDQQAVEQIVRPGLQEEGSAGDREESVGASFIEPVVPEALREALHAKWVDVLQGGSLDGMEELLHEVFVHARVQGRAWVERRPEGLLVNLDGQVAFAPGSAELTARSRTLLGELARLATAADTDLLVETFVTDDPRDLSGSEANWDLALRRSDRVAVFVVGQGLPPRSLEIMGYGYAAGRDDMAFAVQRQLLRLTLRDPSGRRG